MNEVVILIPIVNMPQNRTEEQLVLFMGMAVQTLVDLGALKGNVDDILKDYYVDEATNYINIKVPQDAIGLTNELEAVGAATCPTYKVATDMMQYIDAADGELKTFSAAAINERLRIAMRNPKLRFRYTIMDYKKFYKQKESQLKNKPEMAQKLRNMFLTDVMGMFTEVLPQIEEGKQLATLVGTSQVTPKLNKVARELSMSYRKALRMEKSSGQINKSAYSRLKKSYTEFMTELLEQVFPGLGGSEQKEESRRYSYCKDGRIDLYAEPTTEQIERDAEEEVLDEETRALNEDLHHFEEESQKEYSELGENTYIVAKYESLNKEIDSYYYDLISELHPLFEKLNGLNKNQSIKDKEWKITKITDAIELGEALKSLKKQGVKSFSDGMTEVTFRTTNPEQLTKIVNAIGECGNGGHSFDIVIDPDLTEEEGGNIRFGWDGDGSDRVEITEDKTFSNTRWALLKSPTGDNSFIQVPESVYKIEKDTNYDKYELVQIDTRTHNNQWLMSNDHKSGIKTSDKFRDKNFSEAHEKVSAEMPRTFSDTDVAKTILKEYLDKYDKLYPQGINYVGKDKDGVWLHVVGDETNKSYHVNTKNKQVKYLTHHYLSATFSEAREKVSAEMLEKAKTDGVVQKKPNGSWGIISIDAGEWWTPDYESEEKAKNALEAYHANKFDE
jgi:hypothetical protein